MKKGRKEGKEGIKRLRTKERKKEEGGKDFVFLIDKDV